MRVSKLMERAKAALLDGDKATAANNLNAGIGILGKLTLEGVGHVDGTSVDRWKERFWFQLEENDLLEG